jgi:hypothetical protein
MHSTHQCLLCGTQYYAPGICDFCDPDVELTEIGKSAYKKFTLYWRDGKSEVVRGKDIANAMNRAGYGAGALGALDFYTNGDSRADNQWIAEQRRWHIVQGA